MSLPALTPSGFILLLLFAAVFLAGNLSKASGLPADTTLTGSGQVTEALSGDRQDTLYLGHPEKLIYGDDPEITIQSSRVYYEAEHHLMPGNGLEPIARQEAAVSDWMLYVILVCFFSLALARFYFPGRVHMLVRAVFGLRFFLQVDKENMILSETASYLLKLNYLLCIALLIMQSLQFAGVALPWPHLHPALIYAIVFLATVLFYVLKNLLVSYLGWLFNTKKAAKAYFNNIFVFNHVIGMLLLPLVFYQAFNPLSGAIIAAWALLLLFNLYKVTRGAILGHTHADFSVYYLFLYLCGVELAPLLILGKAASVYLF